jgi:glycine betaine/choline ABC-type transport system substrate-binding protein
MQVLVAACKLAQRRGDDAREMVVGAKGQSEESVFGSIRYSLLHPIGGFLMGFFFVPTGTE